MRDLIKERDLTQITILDITRRAEVNRSTFYEHYGTVDELAASACEAMFDELIAAAPVIGRHSGPADLRLAATALASVFAHVAEHARLYRALVGDGGSARVINHMHQRLAVSIHRNLDRTEGERGDVPQTAHTPVAIFAAGALLGVIMDWLRRGCPGTARQMSAAIFPLLYGAASAAEPAALPETTADVAGR